ncbi:hypothetical protein ACFSRY_01070 [Pontibacter locisalis]|uniref:Response regulatory domain-containing protein n=1 Tax=Pontibacter locisalis TaxID=1719035 RepID=A0ABW5IFM2_9BACT
MIKIIITDDHKIIREGLMSLLKQESKINVVDDALFLPLPSGLGFHEC